MQRQGAREWLQADRPTWEKEIERSFRCACLVHDVLYAHVRTIDRQQLFGRLDNLLPPDLRLHTSTPGCAHGRFRLLLTFGHYILIESQYQG
jgi:hypothetical protein